MLHGFEIASGTHWLNPNLLIHVLVPVSFMISGNMIKESKINANPKMEKVRVFLAPSAFFASPPELTNLNPEIIIMATATIPAKINIQ